MKEMLNRGTLSYRWMNYYITHSIYQTTVILVGRSEKSHTKY